MNNTTAILADVRLFKDANAPFGLVAYIYPNEDKTLVSYDLPTRIDGDKVKLAINLADFVPSTKADGTKSLRTKRRALVEIGEIRTGSKDGKLFTAIKNVRLPEVDTPDFDALF